MWYNNRMSLFILKIIAIISMTIDHIGANLLPNGLLNDIFRSIGRLAFPIFAFCIGEGYRHSKSLLKYVVRIAFCAFIAEVILIIYYLLSGYNYILQLDAYMILLAGLLCVILINSKKIFNILLCIPIIILVKISNLDYGLYGVFLCIIFGCTNKKLIWCLLFLIISIFYISIGPKLNIYLPNILKFDNYDVDQYLGLVSLIPILLYNGKLGIKMKYFFYIYYPAHLAIIFIIQFIISR